MLEFQNRGTHHIHTPDYEPTDIFKFGLSKDIERTLTDCTLGFSRLSEFNDPFEEKFQYRHYLRNEDERQKLFMALQRDSFYFNTNQVDIFALSKEYLSKFMVSCFSETPFEPLMWAHYSEKHKGVCYCFNKEKIFNKFQYQKGYVNYSTQVPLLEYFEGYSTLELIKPQLDKVILSKSDNWAYEKEVRFFIQSSTNIHSFDPKSLQAIIIGCKAHQEVDKIKNLIESYNQKHGTKIPLLYAFPARDSFSMQIGYNSIEQIPARQNPLYNPESKAL